MNKIKSITSSVEHLGGSVMVRACIANGNGVFVLKSMKPLLLLLI